MGCTFCATGQAGFERHLDAGEIVEQVAARRAGVAAARQQRRLHGHGRAARELRQHVGRGASASTTTSGSRPAASPSAPSASSPASAGSRAEDLPVTLAVSLHAADRRAARASSSRSTAATRSPRCSTPPPSSPAPRGGGSRSSTPASPGSTTPPTQAEALGRLLGGVPRGRRRAREPDPAQPDRRVRRARAPTRRRCGPSPTGSGATG